MEIMKVSIFGIIGVFLCLFLKSSHPGYALYVSIAVCILMIVYSVHRVDALFEGIREIQSYIPIEEKYLNTLMKILGIAYLGQFSSGICKDAGYASIAGQIEIFCKLSIMVLSIPIVLALLKTISEFI